MLWSYWAIVAIGFIIAEIFTAGFGVLWFGIAAFCAAGAAYAGASWQVQLAAFAVVGIGMLWATRPLARRLRNAPTVQFGPKALIGKHGIVIKAIGDPANPVGRIIVMGEEWRAKADARIPVGAAVRVVGIEGITLIVAPESTGSVGE